MVLVFSDPMVDVLAEIGWLGVHGHYGMTWFGYVDALQIS